MSFLKNLFKPAAPTPPPVVVKPVPTSLPKIGASTAAQIAQQSSPSPAAQQILAVNPQQTPSQYLSALQENQMGDEMIKMLAHGMPDREGTWYASQSAQRVSDKLPPADVRAMQAAQNWAKNPTPANSAVAAAEPMGRY
jgi:hypothetical protein